MNMTPSTPPVKAQKKHIVLLILAGLLLLISLSGAMDLAEAILCPVDSAPPSEDGVGMSWVGTLLGEVVGGFALFVLFTAVIPCWCMGTVISALLAMNRSDKPKWLWVTSLGAAVAFGLIAAGLIAAWILA